MLGEVLLKQKLGRCEWISEGDRRGGVTGVGEVLLEETLGRCEWICEGDLRGAVMGGGK